MRVSCHDDTCILGIAKKRGFNVSLQAVMLFCADQKLGGGAVRLNTAVENAGLPPRALCMRMPTWTRTITASHSQASSWLCALLECASQSTVCFCSLMRHLFMRCMPQQDIKFLLTHEDTFSRGLICHILLVSC